MFNLTQTKLILAAGLLFTPVLLSAQTDPQLIDIDNIEKLNAIRYDLDGNGEVDASASTADATIYETAFVLGVGESVSCTGRCKGYELTEDLDFEDVASYASSTVNTDWVDADAGTPVDGWEPIGGSSYFSKSGSGTLFQGNGNTISNLYINRPIAEYVGLFGRIGRATIRNLNLEGASVTGKNYVGCLAGENGSSNAKIENCSATGNVTAEGLRIDLEGIAGGLVGRNGLGTIHECSATVTVTSKGWTTGGLVGESSGGTISDSYAEGNVSGEYQVGGLVGYGASGTTVSGSHATGTTEKVGAGTDSYVGGLIGQTSTSVVIACYATGNVLAGKTVGGLIGGSDGGTVAACYAIGTATATGDESYAAGLIGGCNGTISACYATGTATATGFDSRVGGLIAQYRGNMSACYATGNVEVSGTDAIAGGLIGRSAGISGTSNNSIVTACYSTGTVTATGTDSIAKGLVGQEVLTDTGLGNPPGPSEVTITASYFDFETSGRQATEDYAKSTTELQSPTAYGSDIYVDWNVDVDDGLSRGVQDGTTAGDGTEDDPWDFGISDQYPALKVDLDGEGNASAFEFGGQGRSATPPPPSATAPEQIMGLSATAGNELVTLSWTLPADGGDAITHYVIKRAELSANVGSATPTEVAVADVTISSVTASYDVVSLDNGTTYYFQVAAKNSEGTGTYSAEVDAMPVASSATAPEQIMGLSATAGNELVTLSWTLPADGGDPITHYAIKRAELSANVGSATPTEVAVADVTISSVTASYDVVSLDNGTTYYFQVAAKNNTGTGTYSAEVNAEPVAPSATAPEQIMDLSATAGNAQVTLSWTLPEDGGDPITHYVIKQAATSVALGSATPTEVAVADVTISSVTASYDVVSLDNGTTYYFQVAAKNNTGTGTYSAEVNAEPVAPSATANAVPVFDAGSYSFTQAENEGIGTDVVGATAISATDADSDPLEYSLTDDGGGKFQDRYSVRCN